MALKFFPLLKIGLQEIGKDYSTDISTLQNAINSLQSQANALQTALNTLKGNKITKCFSADDLAELEDNEIFEWQGVTSEQFTQGYFYKKTVVPTTQQVLRLYHNYPYLDGWYQNGVYYYQRSEETSLYMQSAVRNTDSKLIFWIGSSSPLVGTIITVGNDELTQTFVTIVSYAIVGGNVMYTDSAGDTWKIAGGVTGTPITFNYYTNSNNATIITTNTDYNYNVSFVKQYDNNYYVTRWTNHSDTGAQFDTIQNPGGATFTQTDTQPRLQNIENASNGDVNIGSNLNVSGNLTVLGTQSIVHTQQIESEKDFIILRDGNPLALGNNEQSGLEINNYDGNGTDCVLAVDNQGWARIGDKNGTLQKLATIEDTPADGSFIKYNATDKELESTTDGSNLTATFPQNSEAIKNNILSGVSFAAIAQYINSFVFYYHQIGTQYLLFADATEQYVATPNNSRVGFVGVLITARNIGNVTADTTTNITAIVYSTTQCRFSYSANNNIVIPALVSYNNRYFCALKFNSKTSKNVYFVGVRQGEWLQTIIDTDTVTEVILGSVFS